MNAAHSDAESRDSNDIAHAIVRLANALAGSRPLRTTVPANPAADAINAMIAPIQEAVMKALGLGDLVQSRLKHQEEIDD